MESSFNFLISPLSHLRDALEPFNDMPFASESHVMTVSEVEGVTFISTRSIPMEHGLILPRFSMALRIEPRALYWFYCRHDISLKFDFRQLFKHLFFGGNHHDIAAIRYTNELDIDCQIISPGLSIQMLRMRTQQIPLALRIGGSSAVSMVVPELEYLYQVRVGIPSIGFQQLFIDEPLDTGLLVYFNITNTQVSVIFNGALKCVFTTEGGRFDRCLIDRPIGEDPFNFTFGMFSPRAVIHGCHLSAPDMVWLRAQSNGPSVALECPVPSLGTLSFYHYDSFPSTGC